MVTQNTLRNFFLNLRLLLILYKCLFKHIKMPILLYTSAPISDLPSIFFLNIHVCTSETWKNIKKIDDLKKRAEGAGMRKVKSPFSFPIFNSSQPFSIGEGGGGFSLVAPLSYASEWHHSIFVIWHPVCLTVRDPSILNLFSISAIFGEFYDATQRKQSQPT